MGARSAGRIRPPGPACRWVPRVVLGVVVGALSPADPLHGQTAAQPADAATGAQVELSTASLEAERRIAAARAAAGDRHLGTLHYLCELPDGPDSGAPPATEGMPDWYASPARVFDNLFFVGTRARNAWAVVTSEGIVVIDPLYNREVGLAVVEGLYALDLDPDDITHVIVSHGHGDHFGGARRLQREFGAEVLLSSADWELALAPGGSEPRPVRDGVIRDGMTLEMGDVTFRFMITPGHTSGTVSMVFDVRDGDAVHRAAIWGGTAMREDLGFYQEYAESARRFQALVREEGADVILSNHGLFDDAHRKLAALAEREEGEAHPFVIGPAATASYLTVVRECAAAGLAGLPITPP